MVLAQGLGDADRKAPREEKGHRGAGALVGGDEQKGDAAGAIAKPGVALLGESHDKAELHRWQLDTIAAKRSCPGTSTKPSMRPSGVGI